MVRCSGTASPTEGLLKYCEGTAVPPPGALIPHKGILILRAGMMILRWGTKVLREGIVIPKEGTVIPREKPERLRVMTVGLHKPRNVLMFFGVKISGGAEAEEISVS